MQHGPDGLATLPPARNAIVQSEIATAFSAAFLTIAAFAAAGLWLAWSIPTKQLS